MVEYKIYGFSPEKGEFPVPELPMFDFIIVKSNLKYYREKYPHISYRAVKIVTQEIELDC
jgi:hypothetical protein